MLVLAAVLALEVAFTLPALEYTHRTSWGPSHWRSPRTSWRGFAFLPPERARSSRAGRVDAAAAPTRYLVAANENVTSHGCTDIGFGKNMPVPVSVKVVGVSVPVTLYVRLRLSNVL